MINSVTLVGRLTKDPELRKTMSNNSVVSFTIAVDKKFKKQGETDTAYFINCIAWNQSADFMAQYMRKGDAIGIEGYITTRTYDDKDGKKVYVTEVNCEKVCSINNKREETTQETQKPNNNVNFQPDDLPFY